MNATIEDLMVKSVVTTRPHKSVGHVKDIMKTNNIQSVPVVGEDAEVLGIITATDMLEDTSDNTPVSQVMTKKVFTVPLYSDVHIAARVMRNQKIHHVVVTHEKQLVGILSAFDLLKLVEEHRFVMKNAPTPSKKKRSKRG
jgi:signal-transduction protein with cAMP-binding, CBS, and nucleotidyltransferase domain